MNGKYLKQLRIDKGLTQTELAKELGYSGKSAIARIENDDFELSQEKIKKYADFFEVSVMDIMGLPHDDSIAEGELAHIYNQLSETHKDALFEYAKLLRLKETSEGDAP